MIRVYEKKSGGHVKVVLRLNGKELNFKQARDYVRLGKKLDGKCLKHFSLKDVYFRILKKVEKGTDTALLSRAMRKGGFSAYIKDLESKLKWV